MRHVIVGAQSPIGSSIIRLLGSLNLQNIVAVSPLGTIPEGVDPKKVVAHFLANKNKYDGITLYHEDHAFYPELERTPTVFGFSAGAFAVNRKYPKLLDRLNGMILESNDSLKTLELCRKYNPKQPEFYCVL